MIKDIALMKNLLVVLRTIGAAGLPEHSLMVEVEVAAGRPLTTLQARGVILDGVDFGWVASRRDEFERTIYWITEAGKNKLAGM